METKKGSIEKIKKIIKRYEHLGLGLYENAACWKSNPNSVDEWKAIGYIGGLAHCFNITQSDLN